MNPTLENQLAVSIPKAAKMLDLSAVTMWRSIKSGKIPACKVGGRTLIRVSELEKLLDNSRVPA